MRLGAAGAGCRAGTAPLSADLTPRVRQTLEQALRANAAGDPARALQILEQGKAAIGPTRTETYSLHQWSVLINADRGDIVAAVRAADLQLQVSNTPGLEVNALAHALAASAVLHNRERVRVLRRQLEALQPRLRQAPNWPTLGSLWQANAAWGRSVADLYGGDYQSAAQGYRACRAALEAHRRSTGEPAAAASLLVACDAGLVEAELQLGNLAAAGTVADALRQSVAAVTAQGRPFVGARFVRIFARLAVEQGQTALARELLRDGIAQLQGITGLAASDWVAQMQRGLAQLAMLDERWPEALAWHEQRLALLAPAGVNSQTARFLTADHAYALLRNQQPGAALALSSALVAQHSAYGQDTSASQWEARAVHALVLAANGRPAEALALLRQALPRWLDLIQAERNTADSGALRRATMNWLLDGAINLLADRAAAGDAQALDEAFRWADLARGSSVQQALAASLARVRIDDPALAALARTEQDLQREIGGLADALGNLLARGRVAEQDTIVAAMRARLVELRQVHSQARAEIERRFPNYASVLEARPLGTAALQRLLKPGEALLSVYAGRERTLVWALAPTGPAALAVVPVAAQELDNKADTLRRALDPNAVQAGKLPPFPSALAHELIVQLLAPVQAAWGGARDLIVVPHGHIGQLPLGVLLTQATPADDTPAALAAAPWLLRQVAVSQLPTAAVLAALRAPRAGGTPGATRAFVGFGDPWFSAEQARAAGAAGPTTRSGTRAPALRQTAARTTDATGAFDLSELSPLPETRQEVEEIAAVLKAEPDRDLFLGRRASEARVKQADLSAYRVVMFATHGLTADELPGLYQPALALALANPALSRDGEDGLLTLQEVLGLKLAADWVVLSACNTAAAAGPAGEAVSGLGRAFFYAGAKSLLVTQWAVETESAMLLTTDTFRRHAAQPTLSRAQALRQAALALMDRPGGAGPRYAHPMYWAPYALVGDGS